MAEATDMRPCSCTLQILVLATLLSCNQVGHRTRTRTRTTLAALAWSVWFVYEVLKCTATRALPAC